MRVRYLEPEFSPVNFEVHRLRQESPGKTERDHRIYGPSALFRSLKQLFHVLFVGSVAMVLKNVSGPVLWPEELCQRLSARKIASGSH